MGNLNIYSSPNSFQRRVTHDTHTYPYPTPPYRLPPSTSLTNHAHISDPYLPLSTTTITAQQPRRMRAVARLAAYMRDDTTGPTISQGAIVNVLLPLMSHFVYECNRPSQHHMVQEAVTAIGALAYRLSWVCVGDESGIGCECECGVGWV